MVLNLGTGVCVTSVCALKLDKNSRRKGALLTTSGIVLISPDSLILRIVDADHFTLMFCRCGLACITLVLMSTLLDRTNGFKRLYKMRWVEWFVAVMFAITGISFIFAVMTTTVANTFVICSVGPLLGALLSRVLLREAIAKRIWIAASVVFVGLVVIFFDSLATGGWAGDCAALVAAFATSINFVVIRKYREINMFPALAWSYALVALVALPNAQPASLTLNDWALMLLLGLFIVPISQAMMTLGPRYLPAPEVSLIQRLEALLAPLLVWLIIGEVPSVATLQGGCLILITLIIVAILAINEETKWRRSLR